MKTFLIEFGVYNSTFWVALVAWLLALRGGLPSRSWWGWKPVAVLVILGSLLNQGIGLFRAYTAPRDIMQDIVSAQEYLAGRSMYPDNMAECMDRTLREEGERRTLPVGWTVGQYADHAKELTLHQHWVQAHPPFMTMFVAGLVKLLGVLGTQAAIAAIALLAWSITLFLLLRTLKPDWGTWPTITLIAATLGSGPVVTVIRNGQTDLMLGGLLTVSWFLARHQRVAFAGLALGLAISFKFIPAILLVVFLVRWPRGFLVSMLTALLTTLLVVVLAVDGDFSKYRETAAGVIEEYDSYPSNLSLLGYLARGGRFFGETDDNLAKKIWMGMGVCIGLTLMLLARRKTPTGPESEALKVDYLFGLSVSLIPLCSPVSWDHYLAFLLLPLAIAVTAQKPISTRLVTTMVLFWCIPETAWLNIKDLCVQHEMKAVALWVVEPLRSFSMVILSGWFAVRNVRVERTSSEI
ncbi:DUF2029 domain-containing protein [Telmatocola sphagniphila]|uniref:DUF2029 domain-containing protein n=1 Tax=Telmatocola sphagniphila TaxID=1123043 RepID=A0A8E6B304_9BACT|nr:glycosyltransferase family 87 protein [Telmatocola sphagniphila]QVL31215.1 DUF2029 domain-containing protein [Telmatocola sphagniphila]